MTPNSWIRCLKPKPMARMRLFCFPYAGGGASIFRRWADLLPDDIEVCPIQLPGRETRIREAPFTQLDQLIQTLSMVIHPYLDKPFAIFGHSMGTLISYEFTRQLRRQYNVGPTHLIVSGRHAPQQPDQRSPIHQLPGDEFLEAVQRRYGGIPAVVLQDREMRELFIPLLQGDFSMLETYRYTDGEQLTCPVLACGGEADLLATPEELTIWGELTEGPFSIHMFPGGHFYLNEDAKPLLNMISRTLLG